MNYSEREKGFGSAENVLHWTEENNIVKQPDGMPWAMPYSAMWSIVYFFYNVESDIPSVLICATTGKSEKCLLLI